MKQVGNFVQDVLETKTSTVMQIIRNPATTLHVIPLLVTHRSIISRASMTACRIVAVPRSSLQLNGFPLYALGTFLLCLRCVTRTVNVKSKSKATFRFVRI